MSWVAGQGQALVIELAVPLGALAGRSVQALITLQISYRYNYMPAEQRYTKQLALWATRRKGRNINGNA